jgi:multicomponent Na+:H+ antiporter subunit E
VIAFTWNCVLALVWCALFADFSPRNVLLGFAAGYAGLWFAWRGDAGRRYFRKVPRLLCFLLFYAGEAKTDAEILLLANLITLTPGSLTLDISEDRRTLFVHAMFVDDADAFRRTIKEGLERRLLEVLR